MEKQNSYEEDEITIDIGELFGALWRKAHIIILAGLVCAIAAFLGTKLLITPKYDSVTKIYVISKQSDKALSYSDLQTGNMLTKDYMEMVKSRPVLEEVIGSLNLDMSSKELLNAITVETPEDTRMIKITVRHENPEMAKKIADAVRDAASIQIKRVMNIEEINTVEDANFPTTIASPSIKINTVISGMLGIIIAMGIIVLIFILDDTIKTPDDVEKYLGLNVLASLPIKDVSKKNKKAKTPKKSAAKQGTKKRR